MMPFPSWNDRADSDLRTPFKMASLLLDHCFESLFADDLPLFAWRNVLLRHRFDRRGRRRRGPSRAEAGGRRAVDGSSLLSIFSLIVLSAPVGEFSLHTAHPSAWPTRWPSIGTLCPSATSFASSAHRNCSRRRPHPFRVAHHPAAGPCRLLGYDPSTAVLLRRLMYLVELTRELMRRLQDQLRPATDESSMCAWLQLQAFKRLMRSRQSSAWRRRSKVPGLY